MSSVCCVIFVYVSRMAPPRACSVGPIREIHIPEKYIRACRLYILVLFFYLQITVRSPDTSVFVNYILIGKRAKRARHSQG